MMIGETDVCQDDRLESYLLGALSSEDELALTDHLAVCDRCRTFLHDQAADESSWTEAVEYLQSSVDETHDDLSADDHRYAAQIQAVLNQLAPSDDPEMLGRVGTYEISGVIGAGGMSVVLKAFDRSLDRVVAIKVLAPHLALTGAARKLFAREAKAAAAVMHPNVVSIHGVSNAVNLPHLVMAFIPGSSLQRRINDQGRVMALNKDDGKIL